MWKFIGKIIADASGDIIPILASGIFTSVYSFSHLLTLTHLLIYPVILTHLHLLTLTHTNLMPPLRCRPGTMCIAKGLVVLPGIPRFPPFFRYPVHYERQSGGLTRCFFATEGRIGGLGAEPRFQARNLAVPLHSGWSREAVVRFM